MEVFKVLVQDRVQQHRLWSRTLTFQFLMVVVVGAVLKVSSVDRIQQRFVDQFATKIRFFAVEVFKVLARDRFQVLHPRTCPVLRMRLLLGSGSELPSESSPSTRRAYAVPMVPKDDESATESESEVEKDCDLWVGRQWMRTAAFPGRWYLLGTGFDGSIWWDEPG